MDINKKVMTFSKEFARIKDNQFKSFLMFAMNEVPGEFFIKPASSTGKYHPRLSVTEGGLVWHTKSAFWFGVAMIKPDAPFSFFTRDEMDIGLAAILFHDTMKYGFDGGASNRGFVYFHHPLLVKDLVDKTLAMIEARSEVNPLSQKTRSMIDAMVNATSAHMGNWNTNQYSKIVLPKPTTKLQKFVHFCDYISSIKFCHFDYEELDGFISILPSIM